MTDSSAVPATTDRITELLLEHQLFYDESDDANECGCGERAPQEFIENYPDDWEAPNTPDAAWWAAHVAALLAVLVADAQTDAWKQGHGTDCDGIFHSLDGCEQWAAPYRSGEGEKLQQQIDASEGEEHAGSDKVVGTHTPHNTPNRTENE